MPASRKLATRSKDNLKTSAGQSKPPCRHGADGGRAGQHIHAARGGAGIGPAARSRAAARPPRGLWQPEPAARLQKIQLASFSTAKARGVGCGCARCVWARACSTRRTECHFFSFALPVSVRETQRELSTLSLQQSSIIIACATMPTRVLFTALLAPS